LKLPRRLLCLAFKLQSSDLFLLIRGPHSHSLVRQVHYCSFDLYLASVSLLVSVYSSLDWCPEVYYLSVIMISRSRTTSPQTPTHAYFDSLGAYVRAFKPWPPPSARYVNRLAVIISRARISLPAYVNYVQLRLTLTLILVPRSSLGCPALHSSIRIVTPLHFLRLAFALAPGRLSYLQFLLILIRGPSIRLIQTAARYDKRVCTARYLGTGRTDG
jgi:hypothetical protein